MELLIKNRILILTLTFFLGLNLLSKVLYMFLNFQDDTYLYLGYKIINRLVLSFFLFLFIKRIGTLKKALLVKGKSKTITSVIVLLLPLFIFGINEKFWKHLLFYSSCLSTGIFEEILFRVLVFGLIFCSFKNSSQRQTSLKPSAIKSSLFFSFAHLSNLVVINEGIDFISAINQIIFAFGIGYLLQAIFIYSSNILITITLHTFINYLGTFKSTFEEGMGSPAQQNTDWTIFEVISNITLFSIIAFIMFKIGNLILKRTIKFRIQCNA